MHARSGWSLVECQPHHVGGIVAVYGGPAGRSIADVSRGPTFLRDLRQGRDEAVIAHAVHGRRETQCDPTHALVGVTQSEVLAASTHRIDAVEGRGVVL